MLAFLIFTCTMLSFNIQFSQQDLILGTGKFSFVIILIFPLVLSLQIAKKLTQSILHS